MERFFWGRCQIVLPMEGVIHITKWSSIYPCKQNTHLAAPQLEKGCKCSAESYTLSMHSVRNVQTPAPLILSFSSLQFMTFNKSLGNAVCFNNNYSNIFPPLIPQKMQTGKGRKGRINFKGLEQLHLHFEMCSHKSLTICNVCSSFIYIYLCACVYKGFSCYKTINMKDLKTFKVVWWLLFLWKSA